MPSVALGALSMSTFARMVRISVIDELGKDYVRAGLAAGCRRKRRLPSRAAQRIDPGDHDRGAGDRQPARGCGHRRDGVAWPGIGQLAIQSIQSRDFLVVQVIVLLISFTYIATSVLADVVYVVVDPRIRLAR